MNKKFISDFVKMGCNEGDAVITLQVYLELCEVKKYWNVEYNFSNNLGKMFITAKKFKLYPASVFIPIQAVETLTFSNIQNFLEIAQNTDCHSTFLVLVSSDLTTVYYEISNGLLEPTDTSAKHLRQNKQEKLDAEIKKHKDLLQNAALYCVPVTINTELVNDMDKNLKKKT